MMVDIAPNDDSIRNDYLAARGAAPGADIDRRWQAIGKDEPASPAASAAPPAGPLPTDSLPIGKRIMSTVGSFLYDRLPNAFKGPPVADQLIAQGQRIQEAEKQLGRPLSLREHLALNPTMESPMALGFGVGNVGGEAAAAIKSRGLAGVAGEPTTTMPVPGMEGPAPAGPAPSLAEQVREKLGTPTEPDDEKPAQPAVSVPRETAAPQRDILQLGDPLEPAVTLRTTPRLAAQADVTLGRVGTEEEPREVPAEGETKSYVKAGEGLSPEQTAGLAREAQPVPSLMSAETIHDYLAGARVDNPVKINLGRIGSGEDIADMLAQVSKTIPENAVQTHEATVYAADALGLSPADFLANYRGQSLNAQEITAMRFVVDSSASQLVDYAKAAREPLASPEAHAQFLKAFTVHRSLQQYMENARNESGRNLNAWKIMSADRPGYAQEIGDLIKNVDASGDLSKLADQVADMDNPLHVNRLVAQSMGGTGRDTLMSIMYNIRLSSPTTIVKKLVSDVGMGAWNMATRYTAEKFGSGAIQPGESAQLAYGYLSGLPDAIRAGGKAIKAGESQYWKDYQMMDTLDVSGGYRPGDPAAQAARVNQRFRMSALANGMPEPEPAGVMQPNISGALRGYIQSALPTSWIAGADDFAKTWQDRASMRALAWRAAEGDTTEFNKLLDMPPNWLREQSKNEALKYTFQEPLTGIAASLRDVADRMNIRIPGTQMDIPWGRMILPFVKVPANIARMAYRSSPLAYAFPSEAVRGILNNPGPDRDILMAQIGLGTAFTSGVLAAAVNGNITGKGPTNPSLHREWEAAGNRPYSLQLPGSHPIGLNQIEPFGMILGATADTVNLAKFAKDEDNDKLVLSLVFGVGQALMSKTYFQGASDFLDALAHPDEDGGRYTSRLIASFVPQGIQRVASATDDWQRAHYGIMDAIEANLPIIREGLPPAVSLWGDPVPTREAYLPFMSGHLASIVSPFPMGPEPESAEPIDKWIFDNRESFPREPQTGRGISKPSRTQTFSGGSGSRVSTQVELTPMEHYRLQVLGGNELKDPRTGLGAKDTLNALVTGTHPEMATQNAWDDGSPAEKALMVNSYITKFREGAKAQVRQDFPDIEQAIQAGLQTRAQQLSGAH